MLTAACVSAYNYLTTVPQIKKNVLIINKCSQQTPAQLIITAHRTSYVTHTFIECSQLTPRQDSYVFASNCNSTNCSQEPAGHMNTLFTKTSCPYEPSALQEPSAHMKKLLIRTSYSQEPTAHKIQPFGCISHSYEPTNSKNILLIPTTCSQEPLHHKY